MGSQFAAHLKPFQGPPAFGSVSCAVFSVGSAQVDTVRDCTRDQGRPALAGCPSLFRRRETGVCAWRWDQPVTRAIRANGLASSSLSAFCITKSKRTRVKGAVTPSDS